MAKKQIPTTIVYLTPSELCKRWKGEITTGTLGNWRSQGKGPCFQKIGSKILYSMEDVIGFEKKGAVKT